jgi:hypothetical protein
MRRRHLVFSFSFGFPLLVSSTDVSAATELENAPGLRECFHTSAFNVKAKLKVSRHTLAPSPLSSLNRDFQNQMKWLNLRMSQLKFVIQF